MTDKNEAQGLRNSAILLMTLDQDAAAEVVKLLHPAHQQRVSLEMSRLGSNISHDELKKILEEFMRDAEQHAALNVQATEHIRAVLTKALGAEKAAQILDDITEDQQSAFGIDKLNLMEPSIVAEIIREEHPQIIATIMVHLDRMQARNILEMFDEKLRNDVVVRIARFTGVQPAALQELTESLAKMLDGQNLKRSKMGGVKAAAEIINTMQHLQEESAINAIRELDEDLAQKIVDEMFVFENLMDLDARSIQLLMDQIDLSMLAVALKGAAPDLQDKFIGNMSKRQAELFRDDMEQRGPMRMSQVEAEQKNILQVVRRLAASGEIVIGGGDDQYV